MEQQQLTKDELKYKRRLELNRKWRDNNREAYNESQRKLMKERYRANPEARRSDINRYYVKRYGMTREEYIQKREEKIKLDLEEFRNIKGFKLNVLD